MECSHVPENRICGPCTLLAYPALAGPVFDFQEGDIVHHVVIKEKFTITKIIGRGSLIMTQEGTTISLGSIIPVRATRILS